MYHGDTLRFRWSVPRFIFQKAAGRPAGAVESVDLPVSNPFLLSYSGPAKKGGLIIPKYKQYSGVGGRPPFTQNT